MDKIIQLRTIDLKYYEPGLVPSNPNSNTQIIADDIKKHGIRKPLIVRPVGDLFEVVCGLARWKGAIIAGLETVPAIVRQLTDAEARQLAFEDNRS